jgi:hypothetical protein
VSKGSSGPTEREFDVPWKHCLEVFDGLGRRQEEALGSSVREFFYEYDFGDGWRHRIKVRHIEKPNTEWFYPLCVAVERAPPPDDVGGPPGYEEFLRAISDPKHEDMLVSVGGVFDPEGFDLNAINRILRFVYSPTDEDD